MIITTCFGDWTCRSFLSLLDKENSVSWTDNFVNVFNSVTSPPLLSYHCVLNYSLIMSVGFHFNLKHLKTYNFRNIVHFLKRILQVVDNAVFWPNVLLYFKNDPLSSSF